MITSNGRTSLLGSICLSILTDKEHRLDARRHVLAIVTRLLKFTVALSNFV